MLPQAESSTRACGSSPPRRGAPAQQGPRPREPPIASSAPWAPARPRQRWSARSTTRATPSRRAVVRPAILAVRPAPGPAPTHAVAAVC